MSEMTMNQDCMYQNVKEIQELNRVEGFDPRKYMRQLTGDGQAAKYYLDVVYRKLWFRLKYPNGKIVKTLKKLTDQVAIVEAKVYLDRNDPEESFIFNALAQKYMTADDQFGNKYVELAETAAVGRALADAGFGLQFADLEGEADPNIVDAGLEHMSGAATGESLPDGTYMEVAGETYTATEEQIPGQYDINTYIDSQAPQQAPAGNMAGAEMNQMPQAMQNNVPQAIQNNVPQAMQNSVPPTTQNNMPPAMQPSQTGTESRPVQNRQTMPPTQAPTQGNQPSIQDTLSRIQRNLPVEQIYKMLNRDMAAALVISAGYYKDKLTLGQLAIEKPQSLNWYVNDYKGPDNLLRAAARFLLDAAKRAA